MTITITLPDGYNGHTKQFYAEPVETNGMTVKLRCATPGKEYMFRWAYMDEVKCLLATLN